MKRFKGMLLPALFLLFTTTVKPALAQENEIGDFVPEQPSVKVKIADPFIELHTGPGSGYPIFYVLDRGTEVTIIRRKTDWFRIESADGKSGWASRAQMQQTLLPSGARLDITDNTEEDFAARDWVLGVTGGEFESAPVFTVFTAYSITENIALEGHFGHSSGRASSSTFFKSNLVMQPLPGLKYSPYLTIGLGKISVDPSATLIAPVDQNNTFSQFGFGIQRYVSRSFLMRLEFNEYVIFSASAATNENEVVNEWKFGFAVFF